MPKIYNSNLVGKKESVVDEVLLLNPHQTPLLDLLGFADSISNVEHTWYEDEMYSDESTVTGAKTVSDTSVVVADVEPFRSNQVIKIGEELLLITAVNTGTRALTVQRGYASTVPAAIVDGSKVEVQFVEGQEGRDAREARNKNRVRRGNLTQIFDDTIDISGTSASIEQYGISDLYEYEKQKKQLEKALELEKALINGVRYENGQVRQMNGIRSFVKTNVVSASNASLTENMINDLAQKIYEKGGFADGGNYVIIVPAKQKRAISGFGGGNIRLDRKDNGRGSVADYFVSDFGQFEIVLNNNLAADELFINDKNRMAIRPLKDRSFFHKYLGEVGDSTRGMVLGEYTLEFKQEAAHGRIKGLA